MTVSQTATKILAVDDEPDFELLLTQRFRRQIREGEFIFRFAQNGEEALMALAAEPDVDLLLLDINMPVMDGLTLLARLREQQSAVRAVIVSAYGDMTNLRTAMNRGAFDFVTKPVDLNDLEITIRKTLDDIGKLREIECQRAAAERAQQSVALFLAEPRRDAGRARRTLGRSTPAERRGVVRRYCRVHEHGRAHGSRGGVADVARVSRADDGTDFRLWRDH